MEQLRRLLDNLGVLVPAQVPRTEHGDRVDREFQVVGHADGRLGLSRLRVSLAIEDIGLGRLRLSRLQQTLLHQILDLLYAHRLVSLSQPLTDLGHRVARLNMITLAHGLLCPKDSLLDTRRVEGLLCAIALAHWSCHGHMVAHLLGPHWEARGRTHAMLA